MKKLLYLLPLFFAMLCCKGGDNSLDMIMGRADSLMEIDMDSAPSALRMLDSMARQHVSSCLLYVQIPSYALRTAARQGHEQIECIFP